jgi:hypothetical protein
MNNSNDTKKDTHAEKNTFLSRETSDGHQSLAVAKEHQLSGNGVPDEVKRPAIDLNSGVNKVNLGKIKKSEEEGYEPTYINNENQDGQEERAEFEPYTNGASQPEQQQDPTTLTPQQVQRFAPVYNDQQPEPPPPPSSFGKAQPPTAPPPRQPDYPQTQPPAPPPEPAPYTQTLQQEVPAEPERERRPRARKGGGGLLGRVLGRALSCIGCFLFVVSTILIIFMIWINI